MNKILNLKKGGLLVAQVSSTLLNYVLWGVVLKPLGIAESITSTSRSMSSYGMQSSISTPEEIAKTASKAAMTYGIAKTLVYLLTTGVFIFLLSKNKAYKSLSMGSAVLGCSIVALLSDFINMTILPSFIFYTLTFILLLASKENSELEINGASSVKVG